MNKQIRSSLCSYLKKHTWYPCILLLVLIVCVYIISAEPNSVSNLSFIKFIVSVPIILLLVMGRIPLIIRILMDLTDRNTPPKTLLITVKEPFLDNLVENYAAKSTNGRFGIIRVKIHLNNTNSRTLSLLIDKQLFNEPLYPGNMYTIEVTKYAHLLITAHHGKQL